MPRWARWLLVGLAGLAVVVVVAAAGFAAWFSMGPAPMPEAIAALQSDEQVDVSTNRWYAFTPRGRAPTTGLILYPGGRVDPRAYAPAARALAERGYRVVIVNVPLNFALLGIDRASDVKAAYPAIQHWAVGGHSLGGVAAAAYAAGGGADGLVLWASFPAGANDLSRLPLAVASIYASNDLLATPDEIRANASLLPSAASFTEIAGGNHAYFGWYGPQDGDGVATISRLEQQAQQVDAAATLLAALGVR